MLYDLKADVYKMLAHGIQENRHRELERQRLVREALAGRQERCTRPRPSLVDRMRKLAKREAGIRLKPAG